MSGKSLRIGYPVARLDQSPSEKPFLPLSIIMTGPRSDVKSFDRFLKSRSRKEHHGK